MSRKTTEKVTIVLHAKDGCKSCGGSGTCRDWVPTPFGHGNCAMDTDCDCAFDNLSGDVCEQLELCELHGVIQIEVEPSPAYLEAERLADQYEVRNGL
jgi:hypothetical protein